MASASDSLATAHHESKLEAHIVEYLNCHGWLVGTHDCYDRERALYPEDVIAWLRASEPNTWVKLQKLNGVDTEKRVLDRLVKTLEAAKHGLVSVLRNGFEMAGAGRLRMTTVRPEDERNESEWESYRANILRVVPQVRYSLENENAVDLVFFINGLPVGTVELKTDFTQRVEDAIAQYKTDRWPKSAKGKREPLLTPQRGAVVHFAVSDSEIYMTTELRGPGTVFLPFNKGRDGGAGNPAVAGGYPSEYFWKEVLQRDNWLRIFQQFVFVETEQKEDAQGKSRTVENLVFPRYHQWEAVTRIIEAVHEEGPGHPYLVAHSAGSGKTKTITWLAHELVRVRDAFGEAYFDSVILVTDRRVLDRQLQNAITQLDHRQGMIRTISEKGGSKSSQLAEAMTSGVPIVVVTLQTFPYAQELILSEASLKDRRFAIVVDEAHSGTGGSAAADLRYILTGESEEEWEKLSTEERLQARQTARRPPPNASYFAFTATPKHSTLTLFGRGENDPKAPLSSANKPVEFHAYTMQQAIEEGFILDVLQNYTTYKTAYRLSEKLSGKDDPKVDKRQARRTLAKWASLHPTNVGQKVQFIVEHFRRNVAHLLAGQAKAMIVTGSRAAAVKYKLYLDRYVQEHKIEGVNALVAFSGDILGKEISDSVFEYPEGHKFNETTMNPDLLGRDLAAVFDTPSFQVMIVANKYQTGFSQSKLVAMYLDKKVSGVEAVQTLSRLNRIYPGKDTTFVVDFVNDADTIQTSFRQFYRHARVSEVQDPNVVYDEKQRLEQAGILHADEIERFAEEIVKKSVPHEKLYAHTQAAADRFNDRFRTLTKRLSGLDAQLETARKHEDATAVQQLEETRSQTAKERDELNLFRDGLMKFVRTYRFIAQIMDLDDPNLEAFAEFARLLRRRLDGVPLEQIDLSGLKMLEYGLIKGERRHGVEDGTGEGDEKPLLRPRGAGGQGEPRDREKERLSELIRRLNEVFSADLENTDKIVFIVHLSEKLRANERVVAQVENNKREDALKGDLPSEAMKAVADAMESHRKLAMELLKRDHQGREALFGMLYDLISDPELGRQLLADRAAR
ncbi:MAG TPA: type I restriction endonuclease [Trueperaceae bacterium]